MYPRLKKREMRPVTERKDDGFFVSDDTGRKRGERQRLSDPRGAYPLAGLS